MIVVIGKHIPLRVRGVLQIWLVEVKPNVFVGDINKKIQERVLKFIRPYLNEDTDIMVIHSGLTKNIQGYNIEYVCNKEQRIEILNGLQLIKKTALPTNDK